MTYCDQKVYIRSDDWLWKGRWILVRALAGVALCHWSPGGEGEMWRDGTPIYKLYRGREEYQDFRQFSLEYGIEIRQVWFKMEYNLPEKWPVYIKFSLEQRS